MGGGQADANLQMRRAGLLGGHQGGELGVLSHDHVRPPLAHRGLHVRQHGAGVQRREHLADDQPLGVVVGQGRDARPHAAELVFRWRGTDPERVAGAPHRVGELRRPDHQHLVAGATTGLDEGHQRMECPAPRVEANSMSTHRP